MPEFTMWDSSTGEITRWGVGVEPQPKDDETLHLGAQYDASAYRFDIETGEPFPAPRILSPQELAIEINRERNRRIAAGKVFDGIHVTGRDEDARNLTNLALGAQMRMATGDTTTVILFRDGDNVDHELTPAEVLSLWQQSAAYVSALYAASWVLKAMEPIPADIAADQYWTTTGI
jgi:hypothetical protein